MPRDHYVIGFWLPRTLAVLGLCGCLLAATCKEAPAAREKRTMADLQWGPVTGWCQISASTDRAAYKASENIHVTVVVKNVSAEPAAHPPYPFTGGVDYEVTRADGKPVELTAFGRLRKDAAGVSSEGVQTLAPGQQVVYEVLLNRRYDITTAGRYRFQVKRQVPAGGRRAALQVPSNVVEFEIQETE